nr:ATP synthase F0 subunit c [Cyperus stolonifer]
MSESVTWRKSLAGWIMCCGKQGILIFGRTRRSSTSYGGIIVGIVGFLSLHSPSYTIDGIALVFSSLIHSVARNPSLAKQLFGYAILGFALTEAIALFALMMGFLILFVF